MVYQVRAAWCFQVVNLACGAGHAKQFCATSCEDCVYYRRVNGLPTNVLVITSDNELVGNLAKAECAGVALRFAQTSYQASAIISAFRPAFVVVDQELLAGSEPGLLAALASDPRIPGSRIILGVPNGASGRSVGLEFANVISVVEKPFGPDRMVEIINQFPVEPLPAAERSEQVQA